MKYLILLIVTTLFQKVCLGQKLKTGTYTFNYCDLEYNMCLGTCKVVIKGDSITIYATKELAQKVTHTKEGDIIDRGIILKHRTGKWIVGKSLKDAKTNEIGYDGPAIIDFTKRQYWTY